MHGNYSEGEAKFNLLAIKEKEVQDHNLKE